MTPRNRTAWVVAAVVGLLVLVVAGGLLGRGSDVTTASPSATRASSGLPLCTDVPPQVDAAVEAVRNDGPYLRPRADGGIFGNRERLLPARPDGYYREYTVRAPAEDFPGPRRLVTGGQARRGAEPEVWFYTADHYESFCELLVS